MVRRDQQEEIDYFWGKLSADPKAEQCGWLKDRFGVSWQIVPTIMNEMMGSNNREKIARVTQAFLKMIPMQAPHKTTSPPSRKR
jgi:predicted 3-demethylubiquinone-9 3-methyltransferase (glyoxalase superfamily)